MKEKICAVYKIENLSNGKIYIGSSRNYYSRKAAHETALKHDHHISRDMQKDYNNGDKFEFAILKTMSDDVSNDELSTEERTYIVQHDSVRNGYNVSTPGGAYYEKDCKSVSELSTGHLRYKINVLAALKSAGYTTYKIKTEKLLSESTVQKLRNNQPVAWDNIERICKLLNCQPGDILEYEPDDTEQG